MLLRRRLAPDAAAWRCSLPCRLEPCLYPQWLHFANFEDDGIFILGDALGAHFEFLDQPSLQVG
jgi:hypothetical protein